MDVRHPIRHQLSRPGSVDHITGVPDAGDIPHRTARAERLCADFGFLDGRGQPQVSACLSALRALERSGPASGPAAPVVPARDVPSRVGEAQGLALAVVSDPAHRETWQGLMEHEHPQGAGPLAGRQMRYLLWSGHGRLGAVGVASPALELAARDALPGQGMEAVVHRDIRSRCNVGIRTISGRTCTAATLRRMCPAGSCVASGPTCASAMASSHG